MLAAVFRIADQSLAGRIDNEIQKFERHVVNECLNSAGIFYPIIG